jgi:hypothetical protein
MNRISPEIIIDIPSEQEFIKKLLIDQQNLIKRFLIHIYILIGIIILLLCLLTTIIWQGAKGFV